MSVESLNRSIVESSARSNGSTTLPFNDSTIQRFSDSTILITNRQRTKKVNLRLLRQIATELLENLELVSAELGVNLVGAREMTRLNETFLRHEGSTDVIAFDYAPGSRSAAEGVRPALHGEIFICVDEAVLQARRFGTSWQSEIVRYLIHGTLHLLGYDDTKAGARRRMKREENRCLRELSRRFSLAPLARPARISA